MAFPTPDQIFLSFLYIYFLYIIVMSLFRTASGIIRPIIFRQARTLASLPIYLDAQATNPTDPRVLDEMLPYLTEQYGNSSSFSHSPVRLGLGEGCGQGPREQIAGLINAHPKGNYIYLWSNREQQHSLEGSCQILSWQEEAYYYYAN